MKGLAQCHTANEWHSWDPTPSVEFDSKVTCKPKLSSEQTPPGVEEGARQNLQCQTLRRGEGGPEGLLSLLWTEGMGSGCVCHFRTALGILGFLEFRRISASSNASLPIPPFYRW